MAYMNTSGFAGFNRMDRYRPTDPGQPSGNIQGAQSQQKQGLAEWNNPMLGIEMALNPPPQMQKYYQALLGQSLRGIGAQAQSARRAGTEALEARGLGQSSLLGRTFSDIGTAQALAGQQAGTAISGMQFQQLLAALDYERRRALQRLGHQQAYELQENAKANPWLSALQMGGSAAAMAFPPAAGAAGGGGMLGGTNLGGGVYGL